MAKGEKMNMKVMDDFKAYLEEQERRQHTINKYLHDVRLFLIYIGVEQLTKNKVICYKESLQEKYAPVNVNSMLAAVNTLDFLLCDIIAILLSMHVLHFG